MGKGWGDFCRFGACSDFLSVKTYSAVSLPPVWGTDSTSFYSRGCSGNAGRSYHSEHRHSLPSAQSHLGEGAQESVCIHTEHIGALAQAHTVDTHTHTGVSIHRQVHTQFCHEQWAHHTGAYTRTHREVDISRQSHPSAHKVSTHACTHEVCVHAHTCRVSHRKQDSSQPESHRNPKSLNPLTIQIRAMEAQRWGSGFLLPQGAIANMPIVASVTTQTAQSHNPHQPVTFLLTYSKPRSGYLPTARFVPG